MFMFTFGLKINTMMITKDDKDHSWRNNENTLPAKLQPLTDPKE
ncbi:hypothetical protein [Panacibacter ginsenosidivorans]|nr:hypothetical protein [Panacibacter ginsenosidivorans]